MKNRITSFALLCALALPDATVAAAVEPQDVQAPEAPMPRIEGLSWRLPPKFATLDGDRLVIDIPADAYPASAVAEAELPPSLLRDATGFSMSVRAEGASIAVPERRFLGLKFQFHKEHGFDRSNRDAVLADLRAFYDGYHFIPGSEPLYNSTICNWYLFNLASYKGKQPPLIIDANVRTDIGWFRRLARDSSNALAKVRGYVERGSGERADFVRQALDYRAALARRPDWRHPVSTTVVEVCGSAGYNWFDLSE